MLASYPRAEGLTDEYVSSLVLHLEGQPSTWVDQICGPNGLAERCKFLPTVADLAMMLGELAKPPASRIEQNTKAAHEYRAKVAAEAAEHDATYDPALAEQARAMCQPAPGGGRYAMDGPDDPYQRKVWLENKARNRRTQCPPGWAIKRQMEREGAGDGD